MNDATAAASRLHVLCVDDEETIRLVLRTMLKREGFAVSLAGSADEALAFCRENQVDFVITDVRMRGASGLELTTALMQLDRPPTVLVMSAYGSVELAIEALRRGAYDYFNKPFKSDEVLLTLRKAEERQHLRTENRRLRQRALEAVTKPRWVGQSSASRELRALLERAVASDSTILLSGESGAGKEVAARMLHTEMQCSGPFVILNCGALHENLADRELFGHVRGAYTDARASSRGAFEQADGGVVFLDQVGELSLPLQAKLLRVLQERVVRPLGGTADVAIDVRVIAATSRNLEDDVKTGRFRQDLYYRLAVLPIRVPPLRERKEDIIPLAELQLRTIEQRLGKSSHALHEEVVQALTQYAWPGNVRELNNAMERALVLAEDERIMLADLPEAVVSAYEDAGAPAPSATVASDEDLSVPHAIRNIEETLIRKALARTHGNRTAAAKLLQMSHRGLLYKLKEYGIR